LTQGFVIAAGVRIFWEPAFEARNYALEAIGATDNQELVDAAIAEYQAANQVIALGAFSIDFSAKVAQLSFAALTFGKSLSNLLSAPNVIATAGGGVATAADLATLSQRLSSLQTTQNVLLSAMTGQSQGSSVLAKIQDLECLAKGGKAAERESRNTEPTKGMHIAYDQSSRQIVQFTDQRDGRCELSTLLPKALSNPDYTA
jgi:hypothetical protein